MNNIIFTNKDIKEENTICFTNLSDFTEWYFKNKKELKDKNLNFKTDIDSISLDKINNLYRFLTFYQEVKKTCDTHMEKYNQKIKEEKNTAEIQTAIDQLVRMNEGGKFLRASLIALGYKSAGKEDNDYLDLAIALEIFQTAILVHDDIIDNDLVRRGKPTIPAAYINKYQDKSNNQKFQNDLYKLADSMGICAGDLGFYIASGIIIDNYKNHPKFVDIISYYNQMVIKTCKGEMLDVMLPFEERYLKANNLEEKIMEVYKLKTAWYSVASPFSLGLILGGASSKTIEHVEEILLSTGVAFQIKDDILGMFGNEELTGKPNTSDAEEFKQTILYSYALKTEYKDELLKYYGKENISEEEARKIISIFIKSGAKDYAENTMNNLFKKSLEKLENLEINHKDILKGFIIYLSNRSK